MSLLRQDMLLPESSIHDFGRDLVISIQYLHSNAIIYCDLKPSNILLDENGRIKLGGFGLSRRLSDINKTSLQQLPPVRAISECYQAVHLPSHCLHTCAASSACDSQCLGFDFDHTLIKIDMPLNMAYPENSYMPCSVPGSNHTGAKCSLKIACCCIDGLPAC